MTRKLAAFEDAALDGRIERLRRSEVDLRERIQARVEEAERQGRWVPSDPVCQRLSGLLRQVQRDLSETEEEKLWRMENRPEPARKSAPHPAKTLDSEAPIPAN